MSVRSAVGITNNNSGQLGEQVSLELASPVNVAAGSLQSGSVCQITLDAGVWVLDGSVLCTITNPADFSAGTSFLELSIQEATSNQVIAQASGTTSTTGETFNGSSYIQRTMSACVNLTASTSYKIAYSISYTGGSCQISTDGVGTGPTTILKATRVA
jgi:hypothetical protein